jgi:hypothetical protein
VSGRKVLTVRDYPVNNVIYQRNKTMSARGTAFKGVCRTAWNAIPQDTILILKHMRSKTSTALLATHRYLKITGMRILRLSTGLRSYVGNAISRRTLSGRPASMDRLG